MCCYSVHPSQQSHLADCVLQHQEKADLVEQIAHCDRQVLGAQADQARLQCVPCGALSEHTALMRCRRGHHITGQNLLGQSVKPKRSER